MPLLRNPSEAIAWAMRQQTWAPHSCLNFVKNAYYGDNPTQNSLDGKPYLDWAIKGWDNSEYKHPGDTNVPDGALMYFRSPHPNQPGDVQIKTPGFTSRRTDVGAWGRVGTTPAMWMRDTVGYTYLGWTEDVLGYRVFGTAQTQIKPKPKPTEGSSLMGLNVIAEKDGRKRLLGNIDGNIVTFGSSADLSTFLGNKGVTIVKVSTDVFGKFLKRANK